LSFALQQIKNGVQGPFDDDQHFVAYKITGTIPDEIHSVFIPQFDHTTVIRVNTTAELLVPTNKTLPIINGQEVFPSLTDLHYKCYFIEDPKTASFQADFETQFANTTEFLFLEYIFCNPVIKTHDIWEPPTFGAMIPEHLICYLTESEGSGTESIEIQDQFSPGDQTIEINFPAEKVCLEAFKDFVPVGGTLLSVDKASLLLAGAQMTAVWLIPVIVSGIGFAIVILRKL